MQNEYCTVFSSGPLQQCMSYWIMGVGIYVGLLLSVGIIGLITISTCFVGPLEVRQGLATWYDVPYTQYVHVESINPRCLLAIS
jgi:hypothetical protein